jgi:predicted PurR-regulated permease PerM
MLMDKKKTVKKLKGLDFKKLNNAIGVGNKILSILYILLIILLIYIGILVLKEFNVLPAILKILSVISPLFIGFLIAWLLNPLVTKLTDKGLNRPVSVILIFALMIIFLYLFILLAVPAMANQIKDIVGTIPTILSDLKSWVENIFDKIADLSLENLDTTKTHFFESIEKIGTNLQTNLPQTALNLISSMASGLGKILLSFIVGFYMLFNFNTVSSGFVKLLPKKWRKDADQLLSQISTTTYDYVKGTLVISFMLMIVSLIGFAIIGLKAPFLIALFCAITNLIPYIGPYMGAAVAALVGFSQSSVVGILTLVFIFIVQTLEGNFLTPLFMSKKMNLHPVTILISLLIFEHFFGIIGMVIATPVTALLKIIFNFFDEKFQFFEYTKD